MRRRYEDKIEIIFPSVNRLDVTGFTKRGVRAS